MARKGIILAGGAGTRLYPATLVTNKQLLIVYDKPMVYYPLSVLMLAGIRDILIISTERDSPIYQRLFGDGKHLGLSFSYAIQPEPRGLAEAFIIGRNFIGKDPVTMILGDNLYFGQELTKILEIEGERSSGATVFGYYVDNPQAYGVLELDKDGKCLSIEEKPAKPKSHWAATGLYFYDNRVIDIAADLKPSARGELEITDVNSSYLENGELYVRQLGRGYAWFDTGTHQDLLDASMFVSTIQRRQGQYIACIEEIAYRMNYIDIEQLSSLARPLIKTAYGKYLQEIVEHIR